MSTVRRVAFDSIRAYPLFVDHATNKREKTLKKGEKTERKKERTISCTCVDIRTISIKRNCLYNESIHVFLSFDPFLLASLAAAEIFILTTILLECVWMYYIIIGWDGKITRQQKWFFFFYSHFFYVWPMPVSYWHTDHGELFSIVCHSLFDDVRTICHAEKCVAADDDYRLQWLMIICNMYGVWWCECINVCRRRLSLGRLSLVY